MSETAIGCEASATIWPSPGHLLGHGRTPGHEAGEVIGGGVLTDRGEQPGGDDEARPVAGALGALDVEAVWRTRLTA